MMASHSWEPISVKKPSLFSRALLRTGMTSARCASIVIYAVYPRAVYHALLLWLGRLQPGLDARDFARDHGDAGLQQRVEGVVASLYAGTKVPFDGDDLGSALKTARKHLLRGRAEGERDSLPPLNR